MVNRISPFNLLNSFETINEESIHLAASIDTKAKVSSVARLLLEENYDVNQCFKESTSSHPWTRIKSWFHKFSSEYKKNYEECKKEVIYFALAAKYKELIDNPNPENKQKLLEIESKILTLENCDTLEECKVKLQNEYHKKTPDLAQINVDIETKKREYKEEAGTIDDLDNFDELMYETRAESKPNKSLINLSKEITSLQTQYDLKNNELNTLLAKIGLINNIKESLA